MRIVILGGGSFGTSIANQLSYNPANEVFILLRDKNVEKGINECHTNSRYFPNRELNSDIKATTDFSIIESSDVLLIAIQTKCIPGIVDQLKTYLKAHTLVVNGAKGILEDGQTIVEVLKEKLRHENIITLKGASFSAEMINRIPTLFTVGFEHKRQLDIINTMVADTNIYLDYTTDIRGVELLSALKNVYAILMGNIDGKFNSANTRFLALTKAVSEIKIVLKALGGKEESIFLSCGIGDLALTSLNDLSRNRTLGLLIGKGFYNSSFHDNSIVLEGVKTLKLIDSVISKDLRKKLPLLNEMISLLITQDRLSLNLNFNELFKKNYTTVLTYGTFDLLHFGHVEILRRAKELGDRLIVGLSTDEFNLTKGKKCEIPFDKRKQLLESLSYVDLVIPEKNWEQKISDVLNYNVDIFVMGDDWENKFDFLKEFCEVRYFPRTRGISTTEIKKILQK